MALQICLLLCLVHTNLCLHQSIRVLQLHASQPVLRCTCRCAIQRLQDQHTVTGGLQQAALASEYDKLPVPEPDVRVNCKAMIGFAHALAIYMVACAASMQRVLEIHRLLHRRQLLQSGLRLSPQVPGMQQLSDDVSLLSRSCQQ